MGYMPGALGPRAGFSPMQQQAPRPPFIQQPAPQFDGGSFPPGPSLPPDFRLQLPPHALSRQPDETTGMSLLAYHSDIYYCHLET